MKNNINKKVGATLIAAAIMAGTAVIPMSNAAVEAAATKAAKATNKPSIEYIAHIQDWGWSKGWVNEGEMAGTEGEARRVEALKIRMMNCEGVSLKFKVHIQDYGDREYTDASEIIGTVGESKRVEAITITSTGLKEKGYKLQYRVHIENLGWSQGWVNEGEMAGTMGQSLRLEGIEIVVVPDGDELAVEKAVAIAELEKYDVALCDHEETASYKRISEQISATIAEINAAEDKETVAELFNEQVKRIEKILAPDRIEEVVKQADENLAKAVKLINEKIANYEAFLPKATDLTKNDKDRISAVIDDTKAKVENVKTYKEITDKLDDISHSTTGLYKDLMTFVETNFTLETKLTAYEELVEAQNVAYEKIAIYEKAIEKSSYSVAYKKLAKASLTTAENEVIVAKTATEVESAISKLVATFESEQFKEISTIAAEEIEKSEIVAAKKEAVKDLEEYTACGYKDVEEKANKYIAEIEKLNSTEAIEDKAQEYLEELETAKNNAKTEKDNYERAKKNAITKLNATLVALDELELSNSDVESITKMIELTKTKIESVSKAVDVASAEEVFDDYMDQYHSNISSDVKEYQFNEIKANALATLEEYVNSEIKEVKDIAITAKKQIEVIKDVDAATIITTKLDTATQEIEKAIALDEARAVSNGLISELRQYATEGNLSSVRVKANEAINDIDAKYIEAKGASEIADIDSAIFDMKQIKKNAVKEIEKVIAENADVVEKELKDTKTKALAEVEKYIELAAELENKELTNSLNAYREFISNATRVGEINNVVAFEEDNTLADECLLSKLIANTSLKTRVSAIKTIEAKYLASYTDSEGNVDNVDLKNDKTLAAKIDEYIATVKDPETTDKEIEDIVKDNGEVDKAIATTASAYTELSTAKSDAKVKISATVNNDYNTTALKLVIKDFADQIDAVTLAQFDADKEKINSIVNKALVRVKEELKISLDYYAQTEFAKLDLEDEDGKKYDTLEVAIKTNFNDVEIDETVTTDTLITAAATTKVAIDTAIEAL